MTVLRRPDAVPEPTKQAGARHEDLVRGLGTPRVSRRMTLDPSQPCVSCGEDTAPGKSLFVGRRTVSTTTGISYLCASCDEEIAAARRGKKLTDEQLHNWIETGAMGVYVWSGHARGGGTPFGE
jgi:hypothetical protein